jgi:hypothetical protein
MEGFTGLDVRPDVEQHPWLDIADNTPEGQLVRIGLLRSGTAGGRASVGMLVKLEDGSQIVVQTTWRLLYTAVRALHVSPLGQEEAEANQWPLR